MAKSRIDKQAPRARQIVPVDNDPPRQHADAEPGSDGPRVPLHDRRVDERRTSVLPAASPVKTVLIVCHANTARSVMAHMMLERMLAERGVGNVRVRSGGVANYARDGMLPSLDARLVLREIGIALHENAFASVDLRAHRDLVESADVILTMTDQQRTGRGLASVPDASSGPATNFSAPATTPSSCKRTCG